MPSIQTLELTSTRLIKIWWAFLWRFALATIGAFISAFIFGLFFGGILGMGIHMSGNEIADYEALLYNTGYVLGIVIYITFTIVPIYFLLNKKFKDFSLVLVRNEDVENLNQPEHTGPDKSRFPANKNFSPVGKPAY